jgi:hypothetical protein
MAAMYFNRSLTCFNQEINSDANCPPGILQNGQAILDELVVSKKHRQIDGFILDWQRLLWIVVKHHQLRTDANNLCRGDIAGIETKFLITIVRIVVVSFKDLNTWLLLLYRSIS